ncbi:hypothetical protein [Paenibacillus sp. PL91]|uniref:hypothetical protein n=1 Tax=Paenibacillus sp. PL91 TaxID=2729538 RepID=UPI00145E501B|nr:hypothetical protein [Paenibacillus sp. PL91]MBC9204154.1 hypothetical protein [Paenibacillus sp. PL91]
MLTANLAFASDELDENLVTIYINSINEKKWPDIPDLWVKDQHVLIINFLNNKQNKNQKVGLFNINKAHIVSSKQIPYEYGKIYIPTRYIETFIEPQIYYVAVNYEVFREDKYHINGVNCFFIVTEMEGRKRKIVLTLHVPVNQIIRDGYGYGTADEKTYSERKIKYVQ